MGQLDRKSDIIKELCTIRKPAVWHQDELRSASLTDRLDEAHDNLECSYQDDSGSNDDSGTSVDDQRPGNNSDNLRSQQLRSGPNVLDPVDDGGSGDVTRPT